VKLDERSGNLREGRSPTRGMRSTLAGMPF